MQNKIRYILVTLMIIFSFNVDAQLTLKIKNVTVINGDVIIDWEYNGTDNIIIRRDSLEINGLVDIATVNPAGLTYTDTQANADLKPRSYILVSVDKPNDVFSDIVSTMHVTSTYDSCAAKINLVWDDVNEPGINVPNDWTPQNFTVHANLDGTDYTYNVDGSLREYTVENVPENVDNTFYIEIHWIAANTNQSSNSNTIRKFTDMPETPDYINAVSASVDGSSVNLKFEIAPNSEIDSYNVLKSDSYSGPFSVMETVNSTELTINAIDAHSDPDSKVSYYKLESIDACDNIKTESDISNNIVLQIEQDELINSLSWNYFKEDFVSTTYEIYRKTGDEPAELIRSLKNYNAYEDDISKLQGEKLSGAFCYYVRAIKDNSLDNYSQSNTVCVYLKPKISIPEAFTPNDDGTNDIFNAVFTFLPTDYQMKIYNRWGNMIFSTTDPEKGWDGKQKNGASAPTGTYIYYIKIDVPGSNSYERRGNVTVIYP